MLQELWLVYYERTNRKNAIFRGSHKERGGDHVGTYDLPVRSRVSHLAVESTQVAVNVEPMWI